ncbi:hypothetical protein M595_2778 [Lyngbya aestuarii BL J]|uniref:Coenzyme Q (Ubiquinone) biosynthesis Coq4 family protein n=1 Tax=Lyngbya aestuarii BL J TaxID=1348334 RepID=U7QGY2_9CYAN|nr:Coq4 family protein [Lyngbya aestuarii]ERT07229.1 hypothetical protein M595_2778 [Lyngbya aestuarii BL J]
MLFRELQSLNIDFFQTAKGFINLLRDPGQTESVHDIEDGLRQAKYTQVAIEYIQSQPGVKPLVEERYLAPPPNLDSLLELPSNSLGYTYASYLTKEGFDPNFYRTLNIEDDTTYIMLRLRQTHDIWHLITGFSTDVVGELGLQAFILAQTRRPMAIVLLAGGLLRALIKSPEEMEKLLDRIAVGYRMGAKAKPFLAQKWEENWEKPISQWRRELGVELAEVYTP